jgi:hypothetical protein
MTMMTMEINGNPHFYQTSSPSSPSSPRPLINWAIA